MARRVRGLLAACAVVWLLAGCGPNGAIDLGSPTGSSAPTAAVPQGPPGSAQAQLAALPVKGRAPMTGYRRTRFGQAWLDTDRNGCDTRDDVLRRDLTHVALKRGAHPCVVLSGDLADPYTATMIHFRRGGASEIDIDHVVALGDAWQTGAQRWPMAERVALANDPLNLLAADASQNRKKGDADAATWLPPNKAFRCAYVARQVAVKTKYRLSVTAAERAAMARVLSTCRNQRVPTGGNPTLAPAGVGG